ncbi:MAG TPA: HNH endonuclease signature motif containing protein, partial [Nocardioidaceae bacterium]|nr:HNH endonuclease signature motif containing protein [Nocardioidaceae bacterium]
HVGVKLNEWLRSVSAPEGDGDNRAPSQRRVDGLERLLDGADDRADGPADAGAKPQTSAEQPDQQQGAQPQPDSHPQPGPQGPGRRGRADTRLLVLADLDTLLRMPGAGPATLAGFGHIGQQLLGYLTCGADITGLLSRGMTDGAIPQAKILNVGRSSRLATARQRHAVIARQDGVCAAPGCGLTRLDVHHVAWWHRDHGSTDLDNLVGLCSGCHHVVHQEKLTIEADGHGGFTFTRQTGRTLDDHARVTKRRVRDALARLRHILRDEQAGPATSEPVVPAVPPAPRLDAQWLTRIDPDRLHSAERRLYDYIGHHQPRRT